MRITQLTIVALFALACDAPLPETSPGAGGKDGSGGAPSSGGSDSTDDGGGPSSDGGGGSTSLSGIAPDQTIEGEQPGEDGDNDVSAAPGEDAVLRVDLGPNEHAGFFLSFDPSFSDVDLELSRWDGTSPVVLGFTDGGAGLRTLAAFDASGPRTFWIRVRTGEAGFSGVLTITRTPFEDGETCADDCDRLLQLPMRNDPAVDGYDWTPSTIFRYQFGRRDLVMFVRHAARQMAIGGRSPLYPEDFSQWDGETPGVDVGAPRHVSHQRGKDVDVSLYGTDGLAIWRSFCDTVTTADGHECVPGTAHDFDGRANAELFAAFLVSQRVTMSFLDRELIALVKEGANEAAAEDTLDPELLPLYSDGQHLQHWPNHDNHIHVRVSEESYATAAAAPAPFEAP